MAVDQSAHGGGARGAVAGGGIVGDAGALPTVESTPQHAAQAIVETLRAVAGAADGDVDQQHEGGAAPVVLPARGSGQALREGFHALRHVVDPLVPDLLFGLPAGAGADDRLDVG